MSTNLRPRIGTRQTYVESPLSPAPRVAIRWDRIAAIVSLIACMAFGAWGASIIDRMSGDVQLVPCAEEDSDDCYWDADTRGNGYGVSFVTIDGVTYYEEAR